MTVQAQRPTEKRAGTLVPARFMFTGKRRGYSYCSNSSCPCQRMEFGAGTFSPSTSTL